MSLADKERRKAGCAPAGQRAMHEKSERHAIDAVDLPLLHKKLFAPYKIGTLIETASSYGISPEKVLANTELTPDRVRDPRTLTSVHDYITTCENILAAGASVTVAYDVGSRMHLTAYGMYGYALMSSPSMREFLDFAVRYHLLATPVLRLGWREEGDLAIWEFPEIYDGGMSREVRDFLVRQQMMMAITHVRDVLGEHIHPERALFGLPDPGAAPVDQRRLGCPCEYEMGVHELHFPVGFLDAAPQFANRLTHTWLEETCDGLLGQAKATSGVAGEIYQRLVMAPHLRPTMDEFALQMGMSARTLRRRLANEDIRFADIADDVSKRVALQYIRTTRMSADDIAAKAGFSDTSNLRRAIKRWTGQTLGQLRRS
jgi:AraC-like DNA-binding protein